MNFEIELGISTVNERCNAEYESPDDVIIGAAQLAEQMIAGEDVCFEFDAHVMALDLFRAGGVVGPLRSEAILAASKIWLSRNQR